MATTEKQRLAIDVSARIRGEVTETAVEEVLSEYDWLGARFDCLYRNEQRRIVSLKRAVVRFRGSE